METSLIHKNIILKLNAHWMPLGFTTPFNAMPALFNGAALPLNMAYNDADVDEGNFSEPMVVEIVKSIDEWIKMPALKSDLTINTPRGKFKIPTAIVTQNYDKVPSFVPAFTKRNVMSRDGGICQYSGKYVGNKGNIDHIMPRSRGGKDTWTNVVWCDPKINSMKSDKTPQEAGLKLIRTPKKPHLVSINYHRLSDYNLDGRHTPFIGKFMKNG